MNCGNKNLILGLPWLKEANPVINWGKETLSLNDKVDKAGDLLHQQEVQTISYSTFDPPKSANPPTSPSYYDRRDRNWLFAYNDFEEPEPYNDRALVATYKQRVLSIAVKKSPKEREAAEKFIEDNLREGKIRLSKSPQAAPFFFVGKKDGSLRPCQDYRYLNKHTVKDAYPLPLISDLVDKLKGASIFTKMDVCSGYNNVCIKDGDQWKVAFITHKGLFESTVMFFGLCNSPATFQQFMNNSFQDMVTEGWLVVYMDDLLIFSDNPKQHRLHTCQVLQ